MNQKIYFASLLQLLSTIFCASPNVIDLSENNFNSSIAKYDTILALFHNSSSEGNPLLVSEFEKSADKLIHNYLPVVLAMFDCSTDYGKNICSKLKTPRFEIFKAYGQTYGICNGCNDTKSIIEFMKTRVGSNSTEYNSFDEMREELTNTKETIVLGIFEKNKQSKHDTQSQFFKASDRLRESVLFRHVFTELVSNVYDLDLLKNLKDMSLPNVVLIRPTHLKNKFEANYVVYSFGEIKDFIKLNYHGLVGHRTYTNSDDFKPPIVITYYEVNYVNSTKKTNYWRNRILKVAKDHRDLRFAISNVHNSASDLRGFGFKSLEEVLDSMPIITAHDKNDNKFILKDEFSVERLAKFVSDLKSGNLKRFVLSEELPEDNKNSSLKVAVANNLEELVLNSDKETLIEFYSPDCGYCIRLEPTLEKLGKQLKNEPKVQIVKLNKMANDIPKMFKVEGFPTIYWYSKDKEPIIYNEDRNLNDFIKFIAKNSAQELDGFDRNGNKKGTKDEL